MIKKLAHNTLTFLVFVCFFFASSPLTHVYAHELIEDQLVDENSDFDEEKPDKEDEKNEEEGEGSEATEMQLLDESDDEDDIEVESPIPTDTDIENQNIGEAVNDVTSNSDTGGNAIEDDADETNEESETVGTSIVETGDSLSVVNIVNLLNSNIIDSEGLILFLQNLADESVETIDLRDFEDLFDNELRTKICSETPLCGEGGNTTVQSSNDVSIINTVEVSASTGANEIATDGAGIIQTGNAYASVNILNFANTNIIGSNYLVLNFDNFGDFNGDLVFPSAQALQRFLGITSGLAGGGDVDIENKNTAEVINSVDSSADTGNNIAISESGEAIITTGNAGANTHILNHLNSNLVGGGSFSVIFRIHGDWDGNIFSLPDSVSYSQGGGSHFFEMYGGGHNQQTSFAGDSVEVTNSNDAYIENSVIVSAKTGENTVLGESGAFISTGDAYASANITNIANTNIIGQNWLLAIINIFGDFNGNVSFGRPDLWIGERVETGRNVKNGSKLNYFYTITNNSDTTATGVRVVDSFRAEYINPIDFFGNGFLDDNEIIWTLESIAPGETVEVGYTGEIQNAPYGETEITNEVEVTSYETDENTNDNRDRATVFAYVHPPQKKSQMIGPEVLGVSVSNEELTDLTLERFNSATESVITGQEITYTIIVRNIGEESVYNTVLVDELRDPNGEIIHTEVYLLGEVFAGEEINIEYTVLFDESFEVGAYTSSAVVTGQEGDNSPEQITPASLDYVNYIGVLPPAVPAQVETVRRQSVPVFDLSGFVRMAEASSGGSSVELAGVSSTQAASIGMLGMNTNHLLLFILLLYLAYTANQHRRGRVQA